VTFGSQMQSGGRKDVGTQAAAATVGSTEGDIMLLAGERYQQTGSHVLADDALRAPSAPCTTLARCPLRREHHADPAREERRDAVLATDYHACSGDDAGVMGDARRGVAVAQVGKVRGHSLYNHDKNFASRFSFYAAHHPSLCAPA